MRIAWENDLAADDHLLLWWTKHQTLPAQNAPDSPEHPLLEARDASPKEQDEKQEGSPDIVGWACREAAQYWGEQLLEALVAAGYEAEVRVHLERQYYQLLFVENGNEWMLSTPLMVQEAIRIIQNADDNQ